MNVIISKHYVLVKYFDLLCLFSDIIICNDLTGSPIRVSDKFTTKEFGLLRRPPDNNVWIALVIAGRNAIIYDTDNATGFFTSKVKQLEALGYHAALVRTLDKLPDNVLHC